MNHSTARQTTTRVGLISLLVLLQLGLYHPVNAVYGWYQAPDFVAVDTWLDTAIPYWSWTWPIYYLGFIYPIAWSVPAIWAWPMKAFRRTVVVFAAAIIAGVIGHLLIPTRAPWPSLEVMGSVQMTVKGWLGTKPLACLPSMHVALAIFPAFLGLYGFKSPVARTVSISLAVLISLSTMTAKEHWALDVLTGLVLAMGACWWWYRWVHYLLPASSPEHRGSRTVGSDG